MITKERSEQLFDLYLESEKLKQENKKLMKQLKKESKELLKYLKHIKINRRKKDEYKRD